MNLANKTGIAIFVSAILSIVVTMIILTLYNYIDMGFVETTIFLHFGVFFIPTIFYFLITKENVKETLKIKKLSLKNCFIVILICIFIQPVMSFISYVSLFFTENVIGEVIDEQNDMPLYLMLLAVGVSPSFFEEIFFRGIVNSGFRRTGIMNATLCGSLFFGLMHGNLNQFLYATFLGILFCYLVNKTGSIFSSMIGHFTINSSQIIISRVVNKFIDLQDVPDVPTEELIRDPFTFTFLVGNAVFAIFLCVPLIKWFNKVNDNTISDIKNSVNNVFNNNSFDISGNFIPRAEDFVVKIEEPKENVINIWVVISIVIYVIMMFPDLFLSLAQKYLY